MTKLNSSFIEAFYRSYFKGWDLKTYCRNYSITLELIKLNKCLKECCDLCVCNVHTGANGIALSEPEEAPRGEMRCSLSLNSKSNPLRASAGFIFYLAQLAVLEVTCPKSVLRLKLQLSFKIHRYIGKCISVMCSTGFIWNKIIRTSLLVILSVILKSNIELGAQITSTAWNKQEQRKLLTSYSDRSGCLIDPHDNSDL